MVDLNQATTSDTNAVLCCATGEHLHDPLYPAITLSIHVLHHTKQSHHAPISCVTPVRFGLPLPPSQRPQRASKYSHPQLSLSIIRL